jgi:hypothetical protein
VPEDETAELVAVYSESQLTALRASLAFLAVFALLALAWVRRLPERAPPHDQDAPTEGALEG